MPNQFARKKTPEQKREYNRNAQRHFRQRRKERLRELEVTVYQQNVLQDEETERLRRENQLLKQENGSLKALAQLDITLTESKSAKNTTKHFSYDTSKIPREMVRISERGLLLPPAMLRKNNVEEIRQFLHQFFLGLARVPNISGSQTHLAMLTALEPCLPTSLKPTRLQVSIPHNVYIDMLPSPSLRDRLISMCSTYSDTFLLEVCTTTCDVQDIGQINIWGENWLCEFTWEFSAAVLEKWGGWLLTLEWGRRANFWRRQRGAPVIPGYD